jgi:hypothetical protein
MMRVRIDRWIFDTFGFSAEGLALYRVFYVLFVLFIISPGHKPFIYYSVYGTLPPDFFFPPPGPMMLFPDFAPLFFLKGVEVVLVIALGCLLLGWKTRVMSIATGLLLLTGNGFAYSMGKINHDLLLAAIPLVMAFSNWGSAWSLDAVSGKTRKPEAWPVALLALMLGFMMFTAGFPKLIGGWLDINTHATYGHFIKHYFVNERQDLLSELFLDISNRVFWESLDWLTLIFEIGFIFAILKAPVLRFWCALAIVFHFMVMMMLNISFISNLPAYSIFLINWDVNAVRFKEIGSLIGKKYLITAPVILCGSMVLYLFGTPLFYLDALFNLESDLMALELLVLMLFLPLAIYRLLAGSVDFANHISANRREQSVG